MSKDNNEFPFCWSTSNDDNWVDYGSATYTVTIGGDHYYPPSIFTLDSKVENIKVLIKSLEQRISVIEQNILRLVAQIDQLLNKVETDGKM